MSKTALRTDADFEALYNRHWKYVYSLCFTYMKSEAAAEDCTEDVFVKVWTGQYGFEDETHERKWLTVTAINLCKDKLKSYANRNTDFFEDGIMPEMAAPEPEDNFDVLTAVMNLPPKLKDVIWLYYYEGYSTDEIAKMLGRRPSTVRNQMRDARNLMKSVLGGISR